MGNIHNLSSMGPNWIRARLQINIVITHKHHAPASLCIASEKNWIRGCFAFPLWLEKLICILGLQPKKKKKMRWQNPTVHVSHVQMKGGE